MGNRAVIAFKGNDLGIYLHWNGGRESVQAFIDCAKHLNVRNPCRDSYGITRLTQIIGNFFGGTLSLGIGKADSLDDSDNGTFTIHEDWTITCSREPYQAFNDAYYSAVFDECLAKNQSIFGGE